MLQLGWVHPARHRPAISWKAGQRSRSLAPVLVLELRAVVITVALLSTSIPPTTSANVRDEQSLRNTMSKPMQQIAATISHAYLSYLSRTPSRFRLLPNDHTYCPVCNHSRKLNFTLARLRFAGPCEGMFRGRPPTLFSPSRDVARATSSRRMKASLPKSLSEPQKDDHSLNRFGSSVDRVYGRRCAVWRHGYNVNVVDTPGNCEICRRTCETRRRCYLNATPCNCETQE